MSVFKTFPTLFTDHPGNPTFHPKIRKAVRLRLKAHHLGININPHWTEDELYEAIEEKLGVIEHGS